MEFNNTIQELQKLGSAVVSKGRKILKSKKKQTKANTLYKDFDYLVSSDSKGVSVEWVFGKASDYWSFVDQGVKGAGGYKGSGRMRGQGSDFRFGSGKYSGKWSSFKSKIKKWIANKPLRLRGQDGKFVAKNKQNINSATYLIQRAIYQRGLERTRFFSRPYDEELLKFENNIVNAYVEDIAINLENIIKK